jgi:hypothetical protein
LLTYFFAAKLLPPHPLNIDDDCDGATDNNIDDDGDGATGDE